MRTKILLAVIMILFGSPALSDTTSRHEVTEELMQHMEANQALDGAKQRFRSLFMQMRSAGLEDTNMTAEEKAIERKHVNKFFDDVDKEVSWNVVKPSFVAVFEEVFSETEIKELLSFYKSPAGKAFKEKFPTLSLRLMQTGQQAYGAVIMQLEKRGKQIENDIKKEIEELRAKKK